MNKLTILIFLLLSGSLLANKNDEAYRQGYELGQQLGKFIFLALLVGIVFFVRYLINRNKKKKQNDSLLD